MRRADRLFLIIHALQGRRTALPARRLADTLGVSLRTVYRDVADLQTSGVPIEGEAGVGYVLRKGADIPPLMFTAEELEALVVGTRFVRAFACKRLAHGAPDDRVNALLPFRRDCADLRTQSAYSRQDACRASAHTARDVVDDGRVACPGREDRYFFDAFMGTEPWILSARPAAACLRRS